MKYSVMIGGEKRMTHHGSRAASEATARSAIVVSWSTGRVQASPSCSLAKTRTRKLADARDAATSASVGAAVRATAAQAASASAAASLEIKIALH